MKKDTLIWGSLISLLAGLMVGHLVSLIHPWWGFSALACLITGVVVFYKFLSFVDKLVGNTIDHTMNKMMQMLARSDPENGEECGNPDCPIHGKNGLLKKLPISKPVAPPKRPGGKSVN